MKYCKCVIHCKCGHESIVKIEEGKIPLKGKQTLHFDCIFCDRILHIDKNTNIGVLCYKGTNDIAIFEEGGEVNNVYVNKN